MAFRDAGHDGEEQRGGLDSVVAGGVAAGDLTDGEVADDAVDVLDIDEVFGARTDLALDLDEELAEGAGRIRDWGGGEGVLALGRSPVPSQDAVPKRTIRWSRTTQEGTRVR